MSDNKPLTPLEKEELYDALIATNPEIKRKGKTIPYTSLNGNMFTFLSKEGDVAIRLPATEYKAFMEKFNTTSVISYGAVMKEYVKVPEDLLQNTNALKKYLELSHNYAKTLKPKPTTKKKK